MATCERCGLPVTPTYHEPNPHLFPERARPLPRCSERSVSARIVYRATVEGVSSVDVTLDVHPHADGEEAFERTALGKLAVNVPGAANAEDVGDVLRAFGALIGVHGAVRITVEPYIRPATLFDDNAADGMADDEPEGKR